MRHQSDAVRIVSIALLLFLAVTLSISIWVSVAHIRCTLSTPLWCISQNKKKPGRGKRTAAWSTTFSRRHLLFQAYLFAELSRQVQVGAYSAIFYIKNLRNPARVYTWVPTWVLRASVRGVSPLRPALPVGAGVEVFALLTLDTTPNKILYRARIKPLIRAFLLHVPRETPSRGT